MASRSSSSSYKKPPGIKENPNMPDLSYGDCYCRICDSHMNSNSWQSHISGRKHQGNVKSGETETKYEDLDDVESSIKDEMKNVTEPIIGLNYIHEIRKRESCVPATYNCFLCHASIATIPLLIEHVVSLKHRLNYLKENDSEAYQLIEQTTLKKGFLEPVVIEQAERLEKELGRGVVKVKQEKAKSVYSTYKRVHDSDVEDQSVSRKSKSHRRSSRSWKSTSIPKWDYRYESQYKCHRKKSYYHHEERTFDDVWKSHSYKEKLSPEREDYSRSHSRSDRHHKRCAVNTRSQDYDYERSVSPIRRSRTQSPEQEVLPSSSTPKILVVNDKYSSAEFFDARQYLEARRIQSGQNSENSTATSVWLAEQPSENSENASNGVSSFVQQLCSLSVGDFLPVAAQKLEKWKSHSLNKDELDLVLKIHVSSQHLIYHNLSPQIQAILKAGKGNMSQNNAENQICGATVREDPPAAQSSSALESSHTQSSHRYTMDDINDLVFGAREATASASHASAAPSQSNAFQSSGNNIYPPLIDFASHSYDSPPAATTLPHPDFSHQFNNHASPPFARYSIGQTSPDCVVLSENETPQSSSQNKHPSVYHWSKPNGNDI